MASSSEDIDGITQLTELEYTRAVVQKQKSLILAKDQEIRALLSRNHSADATIRNRNQALIESEGCQKNLQSELRRLESMLLTSQSTITESNTKLKYHHDLLKELWQECIAEMKIHHCNRGGIDSLETSAKWLDNVRNDPDKPNVFSWAVFRSEDKEEMIGLIVLSHSPPSIEVFGKECLLVGYFFHPSSWGHGYASEALKAGIESVKDRMRGWRIVAWITPGNTASERLSKTCGFVLDRYHKRDNSKVFVGGEWRDNSYDLFVKDL